MKKTLLLLSIFYTTFAVAQSEAVLLKQWQDSTLVGSNVYNNAYNEIWGVVANGKEYAVIGSTAGTHFIDIETATEVAFVAGKAQGGVIIHRDYHDFGGYLYAVADEGPSSLQIIDYTTLPTSVSLVHDEDSLIVRAHNIFIDESKAKLYALGVQTGNGYNYRAMGVYDISTPTNPTFLAAHSTLGTIGFSHFHDAYIKNDTAYINGGNKGFYIADYSDPVNPVLLGFMATYPNQGYNHSGWLDDRGGYYYMADENHGKPMKVVQVSDFNDIQVVNNMDAEATHNYSIPHNQIYHNGYLYASYYYDGLQVYDVSNPLQPQRAYYYDTYPGNEQQSYEGAWGVYPFLPSGKILVSDMQTGLYVFEAIDVVANTNQLENTIDLKIFPQPFDNTLNVQLNNPNATSDVQIQLFDLTGKVVAGFGNQTIQAGENQFSLNVDASLPKGVYILQMTGNDIQVSRKVVR